WKNSEELAAGGVDHHAAVELLAGPQLGAGGRRQAHHAALHFAAVLGARDDFLPGIAALLEIDAADLLEVDHLRHELILRRRGDQRPPGADLIERPGVFGLSARTDE